TNSPSRARRSSAGRSFSRRLNQRQPPANTAAATSSNGRRAWLRSEITRSGGCGSINEQPPARVAWRFHPFRHTGEDRYPWRKWLPAFVGMTSLREDSIHRRQFAGADLLQVAQPVEQTLGRDPRVAGIEAGAELVEQLGVAQRQFGMAAGAPDLLAFEPAS